eukprot:4846-Heterococcus_DN1.PRE.1
MESTPEYNMRIQFAESLGASLGKRFHSCYMDPGTEELIASFLHASRSSVIDNLQSKALELLRKHGERMLSTCSSSKKRREELTAGFAVAKAIIQGLSVAAAAAAAGAGAVTAASA